MSIGDTIIKFSNIYNAINDPDHDGESISLNSFRGQSWNDGSSVPASPNPISIFMHFAGKIAGGVVISGPTFYIKNPSLLVHYATWVGHKTITLEACLNHIFNPNEANNNNTIGAYLNGRKDGYLTYDGRKCIGFMGDITQSMSATQFHFWFPGGQYDDNRWLGNNVGNVVHRIIDNTYPDKDGTSKPDLTRFAVDFWKVNSFGGINLPTVPHTWPWNSTYETITGEIQALKDHIPIYMYYNYSQSMMLYTNEELNNIGKNGKIFTEIGLEIEADNLFNWNDDKRPMDIILCNTSIQSVRMSSLVYNTSTTLNAPINIGNETGKLVFVSNNVDNWPPDIVAGETKWIKIDIDFTHEDGKNLLVIFNSPKKQYITNSTSGKAHYKPEMSSFYRSDYTSPAEISKSMYSDNYRLNIMIK